MDADIAEPDKRVEPLAPFFRFAERDRQRLLRNTEHARLVAALACLAWMPGALTLPALA